MLFPRKIQGRYMMMSRPSDTGHTPFGDIFVSQSEDMIYWGRHRYMMGAVKGDESAWQSLKIGPGPIPIETDEGWLLIYHGVIMTCNGYVYRMGAALLDINEPWKVLARGKDYILAPHMPYECMGDVPNVTFPLRGAGRRRHRPHRRLLRLRRHRHRPGFHHRGPGAGLHQGEFVLIVQFVFCRQNRLPAAAARRGAMGRRR